MSLATLCHCVSLANDRACRDCVIGPWKHFITHSIRVKIEEYAFQHPHMHHKYADKLRGEIRSAAYEAIWDHYTKKQPERCVLVLTKAIDETVAKFRSRREELVKLMIPPIEEMIAQHFLISTKKEDAPVTPPFMASCFPCTFGDYIEAPPPRNICEWLVENILFATDCDTFRNVGHKRQMTHFHSQKLIHEWLHASPRLRIEMGL